MKSVAKFAAFALLVGLTTTSAWSAVAEAHITVPLKSDEPNIDGKVSAEEQTGAESFSLVKLAALDAPKHGTKVYVFATLKGLYVGFVAEEPKLDTLVSSVTKENGAVFNDDSVQILITPTFETAADSYYNFAVNSNGIRYSDHLIERQPVQGWTSAVSKGDGRWEAEFFIPLGAIGASQELPMWRANFARVRPERNGEPAETTAWINPGVSLHNYKKFGYMTMPRFVPGATSPAKAVRRSTQTSDTELSSVPPPAAPPAASPAVDVRTLGPIGTPYPEVTTATMPISSAVTPQ